MCVCAAAALLSHLCADLLEVSQVGFDCYNEAHVCSLHLCAPPYTHLNKCVCVCVRFEYV